MANMGNCIGCGDYGWLRYLLCHQCQLIPRHKRPLSARHPDNRVHKDRERPRPWIKQVEVCNCGRDYLTLTVEEMSQPCPCTVTIEVRRTGRENLDGYSRAKGVPN